MQLDYCVVIPTKNRPSKLARCLNALEAAHAKKKFPILVCDSSTNLDLKTEVIRVCAQYSFVELRHHVGTNIAAARNFCASAAKTDLIINVDDDVYLEPDAIDRIVEAFHAGGWCSVVAGSVRWGETWSSPVKMRFIGYGRGVKSHERPDFFIGAFFIYPRAYAASKPWNENIKVADDQYMGHLLRASGVEIRFEPRARAVHDEEHNRYGIEHLDSHVYANLFDACIANPNAFKALSYEFFGFLFALKLTLIEDHSLSFFFKQWIKAHRDLLRDWKLLKRIVKAPLPEICLRLMP